MNINEVVNEIVLSVKKEWPTLYKIRYVYVILGKYLQKNTDFFFSVDKKLGNFNLSFEEVYSIYNEEVVLSTHVICKSASILMKIVLDRLGIQSRLVKSINNVMEFSKDDKSFSINHWLLAVSDGENEYFCTLSSDLPYIQMGMETKHFGVNIPYRKILPDGSQVQVYEGEEIKHRVLSPERLKEIDIEIHYIKDYYRYNNASQVTKDWNPQYFNAGFHMLRDSMRGNRLFYELEIEKSHFMEKVMNFEGDKGRKISFYDDKVSSLTKKDWDNWIKVICKQVLYKINEILGYSIFPIPPIENKNWNYDAWLLSLSSMIEEDVYQLFNISKEEKRDLRISLPTFTYEKWSKNLKQKIDSSRVYDHENIILLLDKMNALVSSIRTGGGYKTNNIRSLLQAIGFHFIDKEDLFQNNIDENGKLSSYYIANKFYLMFSRIFSCNTMPTDFNKMSYSEQVVIIKEILNLIFPEVNAENFKMAEKYNEKYSPVLNRVQIYPLKNRFNGSYALLFGVIGDETSDDFYFFYDLKSNIFKYCNILEINKEFLFVSNRMKNILGVEDLEDMGERRKR